MATYAESGIHLDDARRTTERLEEIVARGRGAGVLADVGAFGGMFRLGAAGEYADPVLVASTDGVGTKVELAARAGMVRGVGIDIVNHCIDDVLVQSARPLFFLDYIAASEIDADLIAEVVTGMAEACEAAGCALLGGETAEMPDMYAPGEYDLAGFIVGEVDEARVVDGSSVQPGDVVVGLPSDGLHTNGYSLARRILGLTGDPAADRERHHPAERGAGPPARGHAPGR